MLQVNGGTLKHVEKFMYFGIAFMSDGKQDEELDTRIGKASAVMRALHYSVVMKRELLKKAKLSIFKAVFIPILTHGHESWIMTERVRSQVQASEMRFLQRIEGVTLFNKVRQSCKSGRAFRVGFELVSGLKLTKISGLSRAWHVLFVLSAQK